MGDKTNISVTIEIPFSKKKLAEIAYHVLRVEAEPKRAVSKTLSFEGNVLRANFNSLVAKQIRVAVNSYFENVRLILEVIDFAGESTSDTYDHF